MFCRYGVGHVLFATVTFADRLKSTKEAHRRLNSFLNRVRKRIRGYLWVLEPHSNGTIHYHILLVVSFDAHRDTDLEPWALRQHFSDTDRIKAMNPELFSEHTWWQDRASAYGFGRVELAPVYSNGRAMARYLGKCPWKMNHWPFEETKNVRFWCCSKSVRCGSTDFSWTSPAATLLRMELKKWAFERGCYAYEELRPKLGSKWGFEFFTHFQTKLREAMSDS